MRSRCLFGVGHAETTSWRRPLIFTSHSSRKPLSLHTVAFGQRVGRLQTITNIAGDVAREIVAETGDPIIEPSFNVAGDTVRLDWVLSHYTQS